MLPVSVENDEVLVGERFSLAFQRTLRIPEDGRTYPLPPGLGRLPVLRAADFAQAVPTAWVERDDLFLPLYQREALWLAFDGAWWKPNAVQVAVGGIDAISGRALEGLSGENQNYVVCPNQLWLDGVNAGEGFVRQFVAVPLGESRTVEAQVRGREQVGGIQVRVFEPKPGRFPDKPPTREQLELEPDAVLAPHAPELGIGAGGKIRQRIVPDPYGTDTWDPDQSAAVSIQIVNSAQYRELTGRPPPPTPISATTYTEYGLPWFELYDEQAGDVQAPEFLATLEGAIGDDAEAGVEIDPGDIKPLERRKRK